VNATNLAHAAYASSSTPIKTERGAEFDAFVRITRKLSNTSPAKNFGAYIQALHDNRKLWTILAIDVADKENGLSSQLRAQIFYLAEFTRQHTSKVMSGEATIETLVDINTSIMRGLRTRGNL